MDASIPRLIHERTGIKITYRSFLLVVIIELEELIDAGFRNYEKALELLDRGIIMMLQKKLGVR